MLYDYLLSFYYFLLIIKLYQILLYSLSLKHSISFIKTIHNIACYLNINIATNDKNIFFLRYINASS